jgi:hypothetical protein
MQIADMSDFDPTDAIKTSLAFIADRIVEDARTSLAEQSIYYHTGIRPRRLEGVSKNESRGCSEDL